MQYTTPDPEQKRDKHKTQLPRKSSDGNLWAKVSSWTSWIPPSRSCRRICSCSWSNVPATFLKKTGRKHSTFWPPPFIAVICVPPLYLPNQDGLVIQTHQMP